MNKADPRTVAPGQLAGSIESLGASRSFRRNAAIYGENMPADHLYKVISGVVRSYKPLRDGRRQIGSFYVPGDFFGLESSVHAFSAEAVTDARVVAIKRHAVVALAERYHDVAAQLWAITSRELERVQNHVLLLIKSAEERVAGFLVDMADRLHPANEIELPMSRQDIADYLGLTIETVSRVLTHLEKVALIARPTSRRVVLHNRSALNELATETDLATITGGKDLSVIRKNGYDPMLLRDMKGWRPARVPSTPTFPRGKGPVRNVVGVAAARSPAS